MVQYYVYSTLEAAKTASKAIFDLNVALKPGRETKYAYPIYSNTEGNSFVIGIDSEGEVFNTGDILDGVTVLTSEEAIDANYIVPGSGIE